MKIVVSFFLLLVVRVVGRNECEPPHSTYGTYETYVGCMHNVSRIIKAVNVINILTFRRCEC